VDDLTLDKLSAGSVGVITAVGGEGALRCRLLDMGLIPRTKVKVVKTAPMGDPVEIRLRDYALTIRLADAALIKVRPLNGDGEEKEPVGGAAT
jgi:ferrous iron transport protein A